MRPSVLVGAAVTAGLVVLVTLMGQPWWCKCGRPTPFSFEVWSSHNSQHLIDPYLGSHVLHGVLFYAGLRALLGVERETLRWALALVLEAGWEVLENTPLVIDRYRANTMSLDYHGDSVANSTMDLLAAAAGYLFARRAPTWASVALLVVTELVMLAWIRDSLLLNVIMLLWPIEAIGRWQMAGAPS